jgi:hypothetical protein
MPQFEFYFMIKPDFENEAGFTCEQLSGNVPNQEDFGVRIMRTTDGIIGVIVYAPENVSSDDLSLMAKQVMRAVAVDLWAKGLYSGDKT